MFSREKRPLVSPDKLKWYKKEKERRRKERRRKSESESKRERESKSDSESERKKSTDTAKTDGASRPTNPKKNCENIEKVLWKDAISTLPYESKNKIKTPEDFKKTYPSSLNNFMAKHNLTNRLKTKCKIPDCIFIPPKVSGASVQIEGQKIYVEDWSKVDETSAAYISNFFGKCVTQHVEDQSINPLKSKIDLYPPNYSIIRKMELNKMDLWNLVDHAENIVKRTAGDLENYRIQREEKYKVMPTEEIIEDLIKEIIQMEQDESKKKDLLRESDPPNSKPVLYFNNQKWRKHPVLAKGSNRKSRSKSRRRKSRSK